MLRRNSIAGALLLIATWALGQNAAPSTPAAQNAAAPQDEIPVFVADTRLVVVTSRPLLRLPLMGKSAQGV